MASTAIEIESQEALLAAVRRTEAVILSENYRGYDPYDALTSPLFRLPLLRSNRLVRRGAQQVLRRIPFNVRPALGIRKGLSPVTLGLVLQAWASLADAYPDEREAYETSGAVLVSRLESMSTPGWSGACWGYDFDWETRDGPVPAGTPTVVATGFISNGLFLASEALGLPTATSLCESACAFVVEDLQRTTGSDGSFCWSYSPGDRSRVLNATAKGSRLLAQVYAATGREELRETAARSLRYVALHQRPDGSWPYAVDDPRTWSDNFHTGYVLDAFAEYHTRTGDTQFNDVAEHGWRHYREHFFDNDIDPALLRHSSLPTRCDRVRAVAIDSGALRRSCDRRAGGAVGHRAHAEARREFSYRIHRRYTNHVHYMRWSTAWMFCGALLGRTRREIQRSRRVAVQQRTADPCDPCGRLSDDRAGNLLELLPKLTARAELPPEDGVGQR